MCHFLEQMLGCAYTICSDGLISISCTTPCRSVCPHRIPPSCLVLNSFSANLLHTFIMWLMVSSLSPHNLHFLFCYVLPILALIWLVLMVLFCAAIRRDSVSLLKFSFLSHVQVFSSGMLLFSRLNRPWSCFSSYFYFLVIVILLVFVLSVSFLVAVISPPPCFSMWSSSHCIDASTLSSMLVSPPPPSFLDTYSLSLSSRVCNSLCVVISLLILWSICLSSSLVRFKNGPEYLTRHITQVFILLIRFLRHSFVSSCFLVLLRYSFSIVPYISICLLFTPWEFFTSALADGFSLEFEWQQVSSSLQDSSQYSGRSQ